MVCTFSVGGVHFLRERGGFVVRLDKERITISLPCYLVDLIISDARVSSYGHIRKTKSEVIERILVEHYAKKWGVKK